MNSIDTKLLQNSKQFAEDLQYSEKNDKIMQNGVENGQVKQKKSKKKRTNKNKAQLQNEEKNDTIDNSQDNQTQNGFKVEQHKVLPMPNIQSLTIEQVQDPQQVSRNLIQIADEENDSEDEGIEDYKIGGYHPVHIGEILQDRYVIMQKLGWGHFSTVWLARDFKYETYVALKIQKSAPHYLEAAYDEVEILQKVAKKAVSREWFETLKGYYKDENKKEFTRDDCQVVQLLNSFIYRGPYGNHFCMVFEILGVNLLEIIKRYNYKGVPMHLCKVLAKQILIGLDFLHRFCGVIHTDLKPENVLLCLTQEEIKEIVENGQLKQTMQYTQRITDYQKQYGIQQNPALEKSQFSQTLTDSTAATIKKTEATIEQMQQQQLIQSIQIQTTASNQVQEQEQNQGLTKNQKKQKKKKEAKKRKKQQQIQQQQQQKDQQPKNEDQGEEENQTNQEEDNQQNESKNQSSKKDDKGQTGSQQKKQTSETHHEKIHYQETNMFDNWNGRGSRLDTNVRVKIADLGNACWTHHHFATEIQTRQYRSPETILGIYYDTTADIWSFACMIFEMLTGDFLFEPRKGPNFCKDDDHLAQMEELLKRFSKKYKLSGRNSKKFYDNQGNLRRIPNLHNWPLQNVLIEKYRIKEEEAKIFNSFMLSMLHHNPLKRASAQKALDHLWFKHKVVKNYKYSEQEFNKYMQKKQLISYDQVELSGNEQPGSEINDGDSENEDESDKDMPDNDFYELPKHPKLDIRFIDRSFTNLGYLGYGDGIEVEELDQTANWQFDNILDQKQGGNQLKQQ